MPDCGMMSIVVTMATIYWSWAVPDTPTVNKPAEEPAVKAFELRMAGQVDEARRVLDQALADRNADAVTWFESARLHFYTCDFDKADAAVSKAIRLEPDNPRYRVWDAQIAVFNAVMKAHEPLGVVAVALQMDKARKAYEQALELNPDDHGSRLQLIHLYLQQPGRSDRKAKQHADAIERRDPVQAASARCLLMGKAKGTSIGKITLWNKVVSDHPDRAEAHVGLAGAYRGAGRYAEALAEYAKALEMDPSRSGLLFDIAYCHQCLNELEPQARCYQQYLEQDPPAPLPSRLRAMRYLASVEKKRGNEQRAQELRTQADQQDPRFGKRGAVRDDVEDFYTRP